MAFYPYYDQFNEFEDGAESRHIWKLIPFVRILHASPDAPAVDVYANKVVVARNLTYRMLTNYLPILPGFYTIEIYPAGTKVNPVLRRTVFVPFNSTVNLIAGGMLANLQLFVLPEPRVPMQPMMANVRFAHLSPNAPRVDITLPDGTVLFSNVGFGEATPYLAVNEQTYTLQVRLAGTSTVVLEVPNVMLRGGDKYTIFALGLVGGTPALEAYVAMDREQ